jgi:hypothetical protein
MSENGHGPTEARANGDDLAHPANAVRRRDLGAFGLLEQLVEGRGLVEPELSAQLLRRLDLGMRPWPRETVTKVGSTDTTARGAQYARRIRT